MAVQRRVNWVSQQRVDVPDLRSLESAASNDFDQLLQTLILGVNEGFILRGFDISMTGAVGGAATGLQMNVSQAAILHPYSSQSGTFFVVPDGTSQQTLNSAINTRISGAFTPSSQNFIGIEYFRQIDDTTDAQVYIWDPTINDETTAVIPRATLMDFKIVITTGTWATNVMPVSIVTTDAGNNVVSVEDTRRMLFRLGTAGRTQPNPFYSYPWTAQAEGRVENSYLSTSNSTNPFHGGDKMIFTEKDWKDAIMSVIKEIKGSAFWYSPGSSSVSGVNLTDMFFDAEANVLTMRGKFQHSSVTPGMLTWTGDLHIRAIIGSLTYLISASSVTLNDGQVAYVSLVRNQNFQSTNVFTFTNGSVTVNATTLIAGISAGDWIKFFSDDMSKWAQVQSVVGTTITLTSAYQGTSASGIALRSQGTYTMQVANPISLPPTSDTFWIAKRDDNGTITATIAAAPTGASRSGGVTTFTTTAAHGFNAGQGAKVTGVTDSTFNGQFEILTVPTTTTFTVENPGTDGTSGSGSVNSTATLYLRGIGEVTQGESTSDISGQIEALLQYVGSPSTVATQPQYRSTNYVTQGIDLTDAIGQLDLQAGTASTVYNEDRNLKLVAGGIWASGGGVTSQVIRTNHVSVLDSIEQMSSSLSTLYAANGFVPTATGSITSVNLALYTDNGTPTGPVVLEIRNNASGAPGVIIGTSNSVNANSLPTNYPTIVTTNFTFGTPVAVTSGTTYWLTVNVSGVTFNTGKVILTRNTTDSYTEGYIQVSSAGLAGFGWSGIVPNSSMYYDITANVGTAAGLSWSADAFIEIPSLPNVRNKIAAGSAAITTDGQCAYVSVNRSGSTPASLAVTIADIASVPVSNNIVIFARNVGGNYIVGTHSFLLVPGESKPLDAGMSVQNLAALGSGFTEATAAPTYTSNIRGSANQAFQERMSSLTDALGDQQEDRSMFMRSDLPVTWTGTQVQFISDIIIDVTNTKSGTVSTHTIPLADSPLALNNGECVYVAISRTSTSETLTPVRSSISAVPAQTQSNKDIIILFKRVDSNSVGYLYLPLHKQLINPGQTVRLGASGSGGSGNGTGDDILGTLFNTDLEDLFDELPLTSSATLAIDISAGKTSTTYYDVVNSYYTLHYDASKTVTGTGTAMTLSSAIVSYTAAIGDILVVGTEARRITAISGTSVTIESAFSSNPTTAACCVSQCLYTKDINNFASDGLSPFQADSSTISTILVKYYDSAAANQKYPDVGVTPNVAWSASTNGTTYSAVQARPTAFTSTIPMIGMPTAGTNLYLRFFANKTSLSGTVNVLKYKAYWHLDTVTNSGGVLNTAYGRTPNGSYVGMTVSVVAGKTTLRFPNFTYPVGVNPGAAVGALRVYVNGQDVDRFIDSTNTPNASYVEVDPQTIQLDSDYSSVSYSIRVDMPFPVIDSGDTNLQYINALQANSRYNLIFNPEGSLIQRVSSGSTVNNNVYGFDRWKAQSSSNGTTVTKVSSGFAGTNSAMQLAKATAVGFFGQAQWLEADESVPLQGQNITFSLTAKTNSAQVSQIRVSILGWEGTADSPTTNFVSAWASQPTYVANVVQYGTSTFNLTNSYQTFSITAPVGVACNNLIFFVHTTNSESIGDAIVLTAIKAHIGTSALPYVRRKDAEEYELCQRYYESESTVINGGSGYPISSDGHIDHCNAYNVFKRITPTITLNTISVGIGGTTQSVPASSQRSFTASTHSPSAQFCYAVYSWTAEADF